MDMHPQHPDSYDTSMFNATPHLVMKVADSVLHAQLIIEPDESESSGLLRHLVEDHLRMTRITSMTSWSQYASCFASAPLRQATRLCIRRVILNEGLLQIGACHLPADASHEALRYKEVQKYKEHKDCDQLLPCTHACGNRYLEIRVAVIVVAGGLTISIAVAHLLENDLQPTYASYIPGKTYPHVDSFAKSHSHGSAQQQAFAQVSGFVIAR